MGSGGGCTERTEAERTEAEPADKEAAETGPAVEAKIVEGSSGDVPIILIEITFTRPE